MWAAVPLVHHQVGGLCFLIFWQSLSYNMSSHLQLEGVDHGSHRDTCGRSYSLKTVSNITCCSAVDSELLLDHLPVAAANQPTSSDSDLKGQHAESLMILYIDWCLRNHQHLGVCHKEEETLGSLFLTLQSQNKQLKHNRKESLKYILKTDTQP